jgi:SAM-dependent methyltransferase
MPSLVNPDKGKIGSDVAKQGCLIGLATVGHHSYQFTRDLILMNKPLNFVYSYAWVPGRSIPEAYNIIFEIAKRDNHEFVLLKEEDTLAPAHALVSMYRKLKYNPDITAISAVYPRRDGTDPSPFFYRGNGRGSYVDWKWGEFFEVSALPFGCLLLRVADLEKMDDLVPDVEIEDYPALGMTTTVKGYCHAETFVGTEEENTVRMESQDLYFSTKAREAGLSLFVDASVNCEHLDIKQGKKFVVPHYLHDINYNPDESGKTAINLGCGTEHDPIHRIKPVRVDYREEVEPDLRMDLRDMSGLEDSSFDYVYSSHTLEHFPMHEARQILSEMVRICKSGGELHLILPNVLYALQLMEAGHDEDAVWWHLYGRQEGPWDVHITGFTAARIGQWLTKLGLKGVIMESNLNLLIRAFKSPFPEWMEEFGQLDKTNWTRSRFFDYEVDDPPEPREIRVGSLKLPVADDVPDENIEAYFTPKVDGDQGESSTLPVPSTNEEEQEHE